MGNPVIIVGELSRSGLARAIVMTAGTRGVGLQYPLMWQVERVVTRVSQAAWTSSAVTLSTVSRQQ